MYNSLQAEVTALAYCVKVLDLKVFTSRCMVSNKSFQRYLQDFVETKVQHMGTTLERTSVHMSSKRGTVHELVIKIFVCNYTK